MKLILLQRELKLEEDKLKWDEEKYYGAFEIMRFEYGKQKSNAEPEKNYGETKKIPETFKISESNCENESNGAA